MNSIHYTKMHAQGNTYILIDCLQKPLDDPPKYARLVSDPHFGIGSDGLILVKKGASGSYEMAMYNPDGSYSEMCGNGLRCTARYLYDKKLVPETFTLETGGRLVQAKHSPRGTIAGTIQIDMGIPLYAAQEIPLTIKDKEFRCHIISMGNPHCVILLPWRTDDSGKVGRATKEHLDAFPVHEYGPIIERHPIFPHRTNVEFVVWDVVESTLHQRAWERGAGETPACGSGACASVVAVVATESRLAHPDDELESNAKKLMRVVMRGGEVYVEWDRASGHIFLEGKADYICEGTWHHEHN